MGTWGNGNTGPRQLPEWLEGLRAAKDASSPQALLTPLPTFRTVPKGAAPAVGDLFADLAEQLCAWPADSEEEALLWGATHNLSRWVLWAPTGGLPRHTPPAQREELKRDLVLGRIALAKAGRWEHLANAAQKEAERRASRRARTPAPRSLEGTALANEVQRRVHKGEWRSAASLLQSRGLAPATADTRRALGRKLKGGPEDLLPPRERTVHGGCGVSRDALLKALQGAPSTSAPGPSGTRFSHLQAYKGHARALFWLGTLCDRVADGNLPEAAVDLLGLTKLTPLLKDDGGIRPIAGGECLRKLTARALVREHKLTLLDAVGQHQFGAGRPGGAEILVHTIQVVSEAHPDRAWVQLDVANAFPSVSRRAVLDAVAEYAPALLPASEAFLRRTSSFVYLDASGRGVPLLATLGVEQGDVLGPLLFAMAFRAPLERLRRKLVDLLRTEHGFSPEDADAAVVLGAYLDDVLVGLPAAAAARVPELAEETFAPAGCQVQQEKTKVWVPEGICPLGCQDWWEPAGLRVLGAPQGSETPLAALGELGAAVGSSDWVNDFLKQALEGYRTFTSRLVAATLEADRHWSRAQAGAGLLRLCALPRLLHFFRALSPAATEAFAEAADATSLAAYEQVLTAKLTAASQQNQAALPTRLGGCGMLRFKDLRAQAWLGSWLGTLPAVRGLAGPGLAARDVITGGTKTWASALRSALEELAAEGVHLDHAGEVSTEPPATAWGWEDGAPALAQRQRLLSRRRAEAARARLLATLPEAARARVRSCGGAGAGAWILASPTGVATRFTDLEYKVCVRLRLRIPFHLEGAGKRCRNQRGASLAGGAEPAAPRGECSQPLDADGFHALVCLVGGLVIRRHHSLRDAFAWIGRQAGYAARTEVHEPAWTRARTNEEGELEFDQARLDNRFEGPPSDPLIYGDVVVTHPEGSACLRAAADEDGAAAARAADGKHRRYPAWALPGGRLIPFSVETFGRWGKEALDFLRGSADAVAEQNPQVACLGHWGKVALLNAWHTRLSVALQKGNAKCLLQAGRVRGLADFVGDSDWKDDVDDLLRDAAATAGFGGFEA